MKNIILTNSFKKNLKEFRRYLNEIDIVNDVKKYILEGDKKGEALLRTEKESGFDVDYIKLRININNVNFRYIVIVINNDDHIPVILDLKKGRYGKNLSFNADKKTVAKINSCSRKSINDYMLSTPENQLITCYKIKGS